KNRKLRLSLDIIEYHNGILLTYLNTGYNRFKIRIANQTKTKTPQYEKTRYWLDDMHMDMGIKNYWSTISLSTSFSHSPTQ
ncbi:MAG: hypothetical protein WA326_08600, partial [Nitrososphaeraceae archaeon]